MPAMTIRTVLMACIRASCEGGTGRVLAQRLAILEGFLGVLHAFLACAGIVP
jgi:hypothetical protein